MEFDLDFPRAYGEPPVTALFKAEPEDFYVEEQLGYEPSGSGEHLYLFIEKRDRNTQSVAEQLAAAAGIALQDVAYAGLKDRRAVTRQWFSLYLPKRAELPVSEGDGFRVLNRGRHSQKLRRGDHGSNLFRIVLKQVQGDSALLQQRLQHVQEQGVPNYFGEQRFGKGASNLQQMERFLAQHKGKQRGFQDRLRVSAMRSWLFNQVLAERVRQGNWCRALDGEGEATGPLSTGPLSTGPLWGRGRPLSQGAVRELEQGVLQAYGPWCDFLEHCGLQQERRALQLLPQAFSAEQQADQLHLQFALPAGTYATAVLREVMRDVVVG